MESDEYKKRKQEEYEMQLFGFHSRAVYSTLNNMIVEKIQSASRKLIQTLEKHNNKEKGALKADEERLVQSYCTAAAPHLTAIKDIVNKYISIPDNVLLEEDKAQATQYTKEEFEELEKNLKDLQERARRATLVNAALKEELNTLKQFEPYEQVVNRLCEVIDTCSDYPETDGKMLEVVKSYKTLSKKFDDPTVSDKVKYNSVTNLKLVDCDLDHL